MLNIAVWDVKVFKLNFFFFLAENKKYFTNNKPLEVALKIKLDLIILILIKWPYANLKTNTDAIDSIPAQVSDYRCSYGQGYRWKFTIPITELIVWLELMHKFQKY